MFLDCGGIVSLGGDTMVNVDENVKLRVGIKQ